MSETPKRPRKKQFQAEARQLLHLVIHSLYSNKDIVLRELISNASDAIDKLRFESIANPDLIAGDTDYEIRVETQAATDDAPARLMVSDNGIGMSGEEVAKNLGVIAKSGTAEFLKGLTGDQKKDSALIGQFGVGFYSSFILADEVRVLTRRAGESAEEASLWKSDGEGGYTVEPALREAHGTTVTLDLNSEAVEFSTAFKIRELISRYSDHITVPVLMPAMIPPAEASESDDDAEEVVEWEKVNSAEALWTRPRKEITEEEHKEFYKHVFHDFLDPLCWSHNRVEGRLEYTSLIYVPRQAPVDLYLRESNRGLRLYVQRVFIMDDAKQFLPLYLRFVRGVLDCNDLPLNVSREMLQDDPRVESIRKALSKRVLTRLETLAKDAPEDYKAVWENFGRLLKEGAAEDAENREQLLKLLRFASTAEIEGDDATTSLASYVERMKHGQERIYWIAAESTDMARSSPHLEVLKRRGYEVILLSGASDEWLMAHLSEFDGKAFQDVSRGGLELPEGETSKSEEGDDKAKAEADTDQADTLLLERIKTSLGDQVNEVVASDRLVDSAACLVIGEHEYGLQLRKYLDATGSKVPEQSPTLEVNLAHPLMLRLEAETNESEFENLAMIAFEHACLASGAVLANPADHVQRVSKILAA